MSFIPFDSRCSLIHALKDRPDLAIPLLDLAEAVMRADGSLEVQQRELVFAYVSGLNDCGFCRESHSVTLEHFGIQRKQINALIDSDGFDQVDTKMRSLLEYARKLTKDPDGVSKADFEAIIRAGWSEDTFIQINWICALAQFFNRLVAGLGIGIDSDLARFGGEQMHQYGYAYFKALLGR